MTDNHIKRIEIDNFLSFKGKTTVEFHKGFNAITGPSGGGKSNLLKAIFYSYLGTMSYALISIPYRKGMSVAECTPLTKTLTEAVRLADRIHLFEGLSMSPEYRANLALQALIESKRPWSELCAGFKRYMQQLNPRLATVKLSVAPGATRIAFVPPGHGEGYLSTGQKYLLTLAYVLALTSHNKGPLILDDFAALLDQHNAERAARLLKELAKSRQVIVVSRHDAVLAEADRIFGVSMSPKGESKVTVLDV